MSERVASVEVEVTITVSDREAISRVTGPGGDEWRSMFYDLRTEDDVLEHWAYNAVLNNVERINRLEGWADVANDAVTMRIDRNSVWVDVKGGV